MDPEPKAEEVIGGERVQLHSSAVKTLPSLVILESKLSVGAEKSFLISLTKETIFFSRPDERGVLQVSSKIDTKDILAVEGINELAVKTTTAPRRPAHFLLHTFRWKDDKREKRKYAKLLVICANPAEKDRWVHFIDLLLRSHPDSMHNKRFKVLVNPFSGSKTALKIWQECEALFKMSGVRYDVTNTAYARHAKEIASQIDLCQYQAIITVSGDGLLNEVINGLMERKDWQRALSLLLGAIPAGSGNGLARSVGTVDPVTTTFEILKGKRRKMDLMHVVQAKVSSYCFLSVTWALIADIDLESESYRWMGDTRFTVAAMALVASPRTYKGKISWLPLDKSPAQPLPPAVAPPSSPPSSVASVPPAPAAADAPISLPAAALAPIEPISPVDAPKPEKSIPPAELPPPAVASLTTAVLPAPPPSQLPDPVTLAPGTQLSPEGQLRDSLLEGGINPDRGWITIESPWTLFVASNVTHISSTALIAPNKKWGEGCIDLIMSTTTERTDLLSVLLNLEDGSFVKKTPAIQYHKARAFVVEPLCKEGLFSLDGERTEYTPLRCEIHPSLLNILG